MIAFILFVNGITVSSEVDLRNSTQNKNDDKLVKLSRRMDESEEILVDGNGASKRNLTQNTNKGERHRRLIPYMTFYVPGTNNELKLPINQAYNFMQQPPSGSAGSMFQHHHAMQHQTQQQQMIPQKIRGLIAVPVSPPMSMHQVMQQQQHQPKPIVYLTGKFQIPNGITRQPPSQQFLPVKSTIEPSHGQGFNNIKFPTYLSQQPQTGVITQNYYQAQQPLQSSHKSPQVIPQQSMKHHHNHHQSHHQPQSSSSVVQKVNFTPFLPSNKLPGNFVPIQTQQYENNNNLVYHNTGGSTGNGGTVLENSLISINNIQNYNTNNNNHHKNNDQKLSSGKPAIVSTIFVTSTSSVSKGAYQTPANVFHSTSAPNILGQDIPLEPFKFNGNKFNKNQFIHPENVTPKPQQFLKYSIKDEKPSSYYKPLNSNNYSPMKGNDFLQVTPILVTTVSPILVTTLQSTSNQNNYRHQYIPLKEMNHPSTVSEKPQFYPPSSTMAPMYLPKFIKTTPVPLQHNHNQNPSTYHPTMKTYYVPSQNNIKYVTPLHPKPTVSYDHTSPRPSTTTTTSRPYKTVTITPGDNESPDFDGNSLAVLLRKLQETNHLPETLTPDNIDNSIRTLKSKDRYKVTPKPDISNDYDYKYYDDANDDLDATKPIGPPGPNTGRAGIDYPNYSEIPETSFTCKEQRYKGFFGDPDTNCQVWHYCDLNGGKASFLCPNGTIFSQVALTCDWWFNVKCANTAQQYVLNERLYKYILPFTPKFPEDYSGPLVDKYLALKFEEMEEKMRRQKEKGLHKQHENEDDDANDVDASTDDSSSEEESSTEGPSITVTESDVEEILGTKLLPSTTNNLILSSTTTQMPPYRYLARHQNHHVPLSSSHKDSSTPSAIVTVAAPPKTIVESERLHLIEIKTDGSTGHLVRSTSGGGDYEQE
uniref:CSON001423 protein n=1 Tax=Culicoides sonorensis TaxID=179676 RepID=A0A336MGL1_CULSO